MGVSENWAKVGKLAGVYSYKLHHILELEIGEIQECAEREHE